MIVPGSRLEPTELCLAERPAEVRALAERCARAQVIAVDVEADGLFAFRPKLCTLQLAFEERGVVVVGVVDTLASRVDALADVLGEGGPVKVLHDLTFDARLLEESGAPLRRARDTSVAARLLGYKEGGLAALLRLELGIDLDKKHQQHDWSRRPLLEPHLRYLADDVRYLLSLDARLGAKAKEAGIEEEIAEECAYKLVTAQRPPRDSKPTYARVKGALSLDPAGRAVLRRLCEARDEAARAADVPPFKVLANEALLELAKKKPKGAAAIRSIVGSRLFGGRRASADVDAGGDGSRPGGLLLELQRAIEAGQLDGDVPEDHRAFFEPVRMDRAAITRRREIEGRISQWRRAEAKRRGVDEQAVLPGHCAQDLASVLASLDPASDPSLSLDLAAARGAIATIPGMGAGRAARYGEALLALAMRSA